MGLRTIEAPGVEIKEIDKSGYTPAMTGTRCYVMGYATKGEPYAPMEFTSKAAWQSYYGEPDNEAERYFYNACSEVINQNGVLYCARLPYDNESYNKMVGFKYNVSSKTKQIRSANELLLDDKYFDIVKHDKEYEYDALKYVIKNNIKREIDGVISSGMELDDEISYFYEQALDKYTKDDDATKTRYTIRYYELNKEESKKYTLNFNTRAKAEEYIKKYASEEHNIPYVVKYESEIIDKGDKDHEAYIYKYDYKVKVVGADFTFLSDDIALDEIDETESETIKSLLNNSELVTIKDTTPKKFIDVEAVAEGFNYEQFFTKSIQELSRQLGVECSTIYEPYLNSSLASKENDGFLIKSYESFIDPQGIPTHKKEYFNDFEEVMGYFRDNATITVSDLINKYNLDEKQVKYELPYYQIIESDSKIRDFIEIEHGSEPVIEDISKVQEYATSEDKVPAQTFWIFDRTCARLNKVAEDTRKGKERELVGIFPVVTTAANALLAQNLINVDDSEIKDYESVTGTLTKDWTDEQGVQQNGFSLKIEDLVKHFSNSTVNYKEYGILETVSQEANTYFSTINMNTEATGFDTENLKKIGVVVFKAYIDPSEGGKVNFTPVESFCGSLDKDAKNPTTGASTFIDKIVNGLSQYIYFFSNCFSTKTTKKMLNEEADIFIIKPGVTGMLGFYESETAETISLAKLYSSIDTCFELVKDVNERDIDIIPDAGLANIAQYLRTMSEKAGIPEPMNYDMEPTDEDGNALIGFWTCKSASDLNAWKTVEFKFDNFCKNVRKDCMFIADGPRPMVLQGQKKIVRPSKPSNTIDANILPFVKYATGLNTNYGAGYLDWFQVTDEFSGDEFWCPPSIKAMGVYINTDLNFNYWDAPAGLNRGVIQALDTAFSPTIKQAGSIYGKNWNYAINYPYDGIVLEGQKTFQSKPSAFDRVNVRRLFLRLERQVFKIARYFVYEGNNSFTRQRLVDAIEPLLYQVKVGGGLYDFKIKCDESTNDPSTIDRNELKCMIGLKPTKTAEFLMIDFVALSTGGSWSEAGF